MRIAERGNHTDIIYLKNRLKKNYLNIVQEVKLRSGELLKSCLSPALRTSPRIVGRRDLTAASATADPSGKQMQHFGTATKAMVNGGLAMLGQPRQCVLHKGKKGFGFVLRGAKVTILN
jgi:hypothetical protein